MGETPGERLWGRTRAGAGYRELDLPLGDGSNSKSTMAASLNSAVRLRELINLPKVTR